MKRIILLACALCVGLTAFGQTNNTAGPTQNNLMGGISNPTISGGIQQIYDATLGSTNSAFAMGVGHSTTANYNLAFVDYLYNFNSYVGLVLGFDDIAYRWNFNAQNIAFIKGGLNLQAEIAPLKGIGLPNLKVTPFTALLMDSGNGRVGQIALAGANFRIPITGGWKFNFGGFYEDRSGSGLPTDRKYICGDLAISHNF